MYGVPVICEAQVGLVRDSVLCLAQPDIDYQTTGYVKVIAERFCGFFIVFGADYRVLICRLPHVSGGIT